jgi:iron-sulfur cluster assembly protein
MITVTPDAATQIELSAKESGIQDPVLRVAIKKLEDGSLHYAMGFDDAIAENDVRFETRGIQLVVSESSRQYGQDMTIDYVRLDNGEMNFIFLNPNDNNYNPKTEE